MAGSGTLPKNPFSDDILCDPHWVDYSVPGLHDAVYRGILDRLKELMSEPCPRYEARCEKAFFVVSSQAGFGKSHLIGRLFHKLNGHVTRIYVRPFEDIETSWKSLLMRMVQELDFPEQQRHAENDAKGPTQLTLFALSTIGHVVADFLEAGGSNLNMVPVLRGPASGLRESKSNKAWVDYLEQLLHSPEWLSYAENNLREKGVRLNASLASWLRVLFTYAYKGDDWQLSATCLDWLAGESIDQETVDKIGINSRDVPMSGAASGLVNEICKMRVIDLCCLAGFFRPFLICFDQTELYGKHPGLSRALGSMISELTRNGQNQLTLLTSNLEPWGKLLQPSWDEAELACLTMPMMLGSIQQEQADRLINHRLAVSSAEDGFKGQFLADRSWYSGLVKSNAQLSVRRLLNECSTRWQLTGDGGASSSVESTQSAPQQAEITPETAQPKPQPQVKADVKPVAEAKAPKPAQVQPQVQPDQANVSEEIEIAIEGLEPDQFELEPAVESILMSDAEDKVPVKPAPKPDSSSKKTSAALAEPAPEVAPPKPLSLDEIYLRFQEAVKQHTRRQVYDRDTLYWLVYELANGLGGIKVDKAPLQNRDMAPRWQFKDSIFLFGFEVGSHWMRWRNVAFMAMQGNRGSEGATMVYFRTPEQQIIPKASWKGAEKLVRRAMASKKLHILQLKLPMLCRIYAAHDMYVEAVKGNIKASKEDVAAFLREQLADLWKLILDWDRNGK